MKKTFWVIGLLASLTVLIFIGIAVYMIGFIHGRDEEFRLANLRKSEKKETMNAFSPKILYLEQVPQISKKILQDSPNSVEVLGEVKLRYPTGYTIVNQNSGSLFFVRKDNKYLEGVREVVKCWQDMDSGKTVLGLCWEGSVLGDVSVNVEMVDLIKDYEGCHVQKSTDMTRIIYSCLAPGFANEPIHEYYLYSKREEGHWRMHISTLEPFSNSELLDALIVSSQI